MKQQIERVIADILKTNYPNAQNVVFTVLPPPDNVNADYATNVAMVLAKILNKNPMEIAKHISSHLKLSELKNLEVNVLEPGFLNFFLPLSRLLDNLESILRDINGYATSPTPKNQVALIEYFQLNAAKLPHIGHLRSAVIGDSLKRILSRLGFYVISDTHIGDWGTQFGLLLYAYKNFGGAEKLSQSPADALTVLNDLYVQINMLQENKPELRELAKKEFVKLEQGDPENQILWKRFVEISKEKMNDSAESLKLLPFDLNLGESFYSGRMKLLINRLEQNNLLTTGKTGERYVDLEKWGLGRLICVKSDGGTTYEMRDLATLAYRYDELLTTKITQINKNMELALNLYVVDSRQGHDFKQVFKTMELLGYDISKSIHVNFGFMSLPEGAFSTRRGNIISLEKLIEEANNRALEIINQKNPTLAQKETVASIVALGAIKYNDLKHNRKSDIVFTWEEALSFEGNTGPYLQYTHARLRSILRKVKIEENTVNQIKIEDSLKINKIERELLVRLLYFPETVLEAGTSFQPNVLATYLYKFAENVNLFYQKMPVLKEGDPILRNFRLRLVMASSQVLKTGLYLLGIEAPDEM